MKKNIGLKIAFVGSKLWDKGGWTGHESYNDLTLIGRVGYKLFIKGLEFSGLRHNDILKFKY